VREIERARDLWEATHFDAAADTLEAAAGKVPQKILFLTVGNLARGLAARHRLHFKDAQTFFGEAARVLPSLLDGRGLDHQLTTFARQSAQLCGALKGESPDRLLLLNELLDNTLRTAAQNRFEDAAARLYRCMEMRLQIWLEEKTNGLFTNGVCPSQKIPPSWPTGLEPLGSLARHPEWGGIQLPLREIIKTLHSLHDERVAAMMEDYALCKSSRIQNVARLRNQGILAHGTSAVGAEGFEEFKTVASEFFGFDLSRERNPIPSLDPRWLQADIPDFPNPAGGV
jgi:hypothetical protein